ncbi:MAG: glutathione S-transferase family protein [Pseudomonadota bacterium]
MIKIYGTHGSPFVRKVVVALDLKAIPYELVHQMPFARDEQYERLNPMGRIPTLVDDAVTLGDSKVICRYLETVKADPPLYPTDQAQRAHADWYEELAGDRLAEYAAGIFFQRFMKPFAFKQEPDEELIDKIISKRLPPMLSYLEDKMPTNGYLFGSLMMADLSIVSPFINAAYAGYEVSAQSYPKLAGLIDRVRSEPAVVRVLAEEAKIFGFESS